jgi:hypothetical protein
MGSPKVHFLKLDYCCLCDYLDCYLGYDQQCPLATRFYFELRSFTQFYLVYLVL